VLDLVEFDRRLTPDEALARWTATPRQPVHPALVRWTEHAVLSYLTASAEIPPAPGVPSGLALEPVSRRWARQRKRRKPEEPDVYEEMVTDRRYEGHGVRELRLVRMGSVKDRLEDSTEIAVGVGVLAGGSPVLGSPWANGQLVLGRFHRPRLVRLVEIGCEDASWHVLFEGTPDEAHAHYGDAVERRLAAAMAGGSYRPGKDCVSCHAVANCPELPLRPGLLGVTGAGLPRRSWSVSTGRSYRRCPARSHLEDLFLPSESSAEHTDAAARGQAVHAWIEKRHRRTPSHPCVADDVPASAEEWECGGWTVTGEQARLGIQMIGDHALVCPVGSPSAGSAVHVEHPVVVYDPEADVVVVAKTDLLHRVSGQWILRETKTTTVASTEDLLDAYPQLALAVLLSRAAALPGNETCGVELERLTSRGPLVSRIDTCAADVADQARGVVRALVSAWRTDTGHSTKSGPACADCPFTKWCPDAAEGTKT
jgi:hypothetical protein